MIYTIISKLPWITSDTSNRRFFKIFVFGSLIYLLLHYYLFQTVHEGLLETVKSYIYYEMALDLCAAYVLDKYFGPTNASNENDITLPNSSDTKHNNLQNVQPTTQPITQPTTQPNTQPPKLTQEQIAEYEKKYIQFRSQQDFAKRKSQSHEDTQDNSFKQSENVSDDNSSLPKISKKNRAENSDRSQNSKKLSEQNIEDTDLPKYIRK